MLTPDKARDFIWSHRASLGSRVVTYRRGNDAVTLEAVPHGRKLYRLEGADGSVRIEYTDRGYLLAAADLVLNGEAVEPQTGDTITDDNDGVAATVYEVRAPGGEKPWDWFAGGRAYRLIHTKLAGPA